MTVSNEDTRTIVNGGFRELRAGNGYYIDKTALIDAVLGSGRRVFHFSRPTGFGKSLSLDMLDAYLDSRHAGGPDLFDGLEVKRLRPDDPEKGSYTVVRLSLEGLWNRDRDGFISMLGRRMADVYARFPELGSSVRLDGREASYYIRIASGSADEEDLGASLLNLTRMLEKEHGRRVVLLVDDCDDTVYRAESPDQRSEAASLLSRILSTALGDDPSLKLAALAGISPADACPVLDNVRIDGILDPGLGEFWGFTEEEVGRACADFGDADRLREAEEWYGGYVFSGAESCRPRSVMGYLERGFGTGTCRGDDRILETMYGTTTLGDFVQTAELISGGSFDTALGSPASWRADRASLYSLMAAAGYLRAVPAEGREGCFTVSFPNKEVRAVMRSTVERMAPIMTADLDGFLKAFNKDDAVATERIMGELLIFKSRWDLADGMPYEIVPLTILYSIADRCTFRFRDEAKEKGRVAIFMTAKDPGLINIIWEIRADPTGKWLRTEAGRALGRIRTRTSYVGMKGTALMYGISFSERTACIRYHDLTMPKMSLDF